ncbi:hypothetical protein GDO81_014418 [Engystomops pustulosus]|uniref:NADH dehydrogenase subunit 5 n=1 Tax=Engystomops pustulosus TaxID=76066 RepID=A0AAV7BAC7_ENGPU|nr:hypothetical protein GDO81_014418 [Engystomops pustulosus]
MLGKIAAGCYIYKYPAQTAYSYQNIYAVYKHQLFTILIKHIHTKYIREPFKYVYQYTILYKNNTFLLSISLIFMWALSGHK